MFYFSIEAFFHLSVDIAAYEYDIDTEHNFCFTRDNQKNQIYPD